MRKEIEADAERLLVKAVRAESGLCLKIRFLGVMGAPDRIVMLPGGRFFFVELKKNTGGQLEASQYLMFRRLSTLGFAIHILHGVAETQTFIDTHIKTVP